ncbi:2-phospho-L-lactate guanylyltransferase [Sporotomaculum syntrophicum]|uniref:2-phospho-L-lactate guanylyltransferase n=1 Tax=Sporotomaculum syntrophicum TaxID=182264 RepID=A0A9D2WRZ6_9FIRM|nr:TIGR04282 family arsenosugar biosynthesis glycosyltransferase [Sporotomaculum syntrophicum]KAF1085522.1 2-phospho-L-lactate guanylyltransferase [Sporotomaculum syntrophicum]
MGKPALVVMARVPSAEGKSRLSKVLAPEQRETLQWAFLLDTMEKVRQLAGVKVYIAATPPDRINELRQALNPRATIIPQPNGDLGQRMLSALYYAHGLGYSPVILIGTDTPLLPTAYLTKAINMLDKYHVVCGPALDGGYYLIGMGRPREGLFQDIHWGGSDVLQRTVNACRRYHLTYGLLEPLSDVDRPPDLLALAGKIKKMYPGHPDFPIRTGRFLAKLHFRHS